MPTSSVQANKPTTPINNSKMTHRMRSYLANQYVNDHTLKASRLVKQVICAAARSPLIDALARTSSTVRLTLTDDIRSLHFAIMVS